jgi:hypothetical protein
MDQATQQNAALVEETATAAASLREQTDHLVKAVRAFKLGNVRFAMASGAAQRGLSRLPARAPARIAAG